MFLSKFVYLKFEFLNSLSLVSAHRVFQIFVKKKIFLLIYKTYSVLTNIVYDIKILGFSSLLDILFTPMGNNDY